MADRIKYVLDEPRTVPSMGGKLVLPGSIHDVPEGWDIEQFTDQTGNWAPVKSTTKKEG